MAFRGYVATEIAGDAVDGIISRREALRRLLLLGLSLSAASALLAGCGDDDDDDAGSSGTTPPSEAKTTVTTAAPSTKPAEIIKFAGPNGELTASFAAATDAKGDVLIVHENKGLTDHFKGLPDRLAAAGYNALCVDLLSKEGGTGKFSDPAQATAALTTIPRDELVKDLSAGLDELIKRGPGLKLGVMGFCFGGGMTWSLLNAGEARLAAAIPFYGPLPEPVDFSRAKAAVLAIYGEQDSFVNPSRDAAIAALEKAKLTHEVKTYPGVGHAFFNDTGPRYNAEAATAAYQQVKDWFGRYLGPG